MEIKLFSFWHLFFILVAVVFCVVLYFILRNKSDKTKKTTLLIFLLLGLILHFLKVFIPPYSTNIEIWFREGWFTNICAANILLFPFILLSKSDKAKDYMFYLGLLGGGIAILYPLEVFQKANQTAEWLDILRFYYHHITIFAIPLLMVILKFHKLNYKRVLWVPIYFSAVLAFIMVNQILQSELGYVALRNSDFLNINYKNSSLIWGPGNEPVGKIFTVVCPNIFKTVPVGAYAGQVKYWPLIWLIVPIYVYVVPLSFLFCLIFDFKHFKSDITNIFNKKFKQN